MRVGWAIALAVVWWLVAPMPASSAGPDASSIALKLESPGVRAVELTPMPDSRDGEFRFRVETDEGTSNLSPEEFTRLLYDRHHGRPFWKSFLNITNPVGIAWVALGLLGQVLFAGRMAVQWLTSEKRGRSVVPVAFWWMSLAGASMLLVYFIWRKDVVGVLGQSTGWLIYARNLYMIHTRGVGEADQAVPERREACPAD